MGKKNPEHQALYTKRNPLHSARSSLIDVRTSFATKQKKLIDQIRQRIARRGSTNEEGNGSFRDGSNTDPPRFEQVSRPALQTAMRGSSKSNKLNNAAQKSVLKPDIRKNNDNPELVESRPTEEQPHAAQPKQEEVGSSTDSEGDLKLNAPPPKASVTTVEGLSELLFSDDYLNYIVQDTVLYTRFAQFLYQYQPQYVSILLHHIEIQKATKALEYANAVAGSLGPFPGDSDSRGIQKAAAMNQELEARRKRVVDILVSEALPTQINFSLIDVVTSAMRKAIRGTKQTSAMRDLIGGLTEVFTLTDPSIEDNPIIYASEEFYNMTGYGRDFVIGRNCRFLQGPKTNRHSVRRLKTCIDGGTEISETLLNYRRDGTPFVNLLLVAPLHDNKGHVKYYIGAQVDVTGLVEEGQGLEGFGDFVRTRKKQDDLKKRGMWEDRGENSPALQKLAELSEMFDLSENAIVRSHSRSNSLTMESIVSAQSAQKPTGQNRRIIIQEPSSSDDEESTVGGKPQLPGYLENELKWKLAPPGAQTGILPGVYQKYLLLRPAPSLKVIFVSPALRKLSKLSKRGFMDCFESSRSTMSQLKKAFETGLPVSAKVSLKYEDSQDLTNGQRKLHKAKGDTWISATPMLGSDDSIGVWIIVVVQNSSPNQAVNEESPSMSISEYQQQTPRNESTTSVFSANSPKKVLEPQRNTSVRLNRENQSPMFATSGQKYPQSTPTPSRFKSNSLSTTRTNTPRASTSNVTSNSSQRNFSYNQYSPFPPPNLPLPPAPTGSSHASTLADPGNDGASTLASPKLSDSAQSPDLGDGGSEMPTGRIRINGGSDDSGVDTVDEDAAEKGKEVMGNVTPKSRESKFKEHVPEKWSPPSKGIWTKPPRPGVPDGMMGGVD